MITGPLPQARELPDDTIDFNSAISVSRVTAWAADVLRFHAGDPTWSEWEMRGTNTDGTAALIRGCVICTFRGDLIDWTRFYLDPVTDTAFYPAR